jgi:hypothetical protein
MSAVNGSSHDSSDAVYDNFLGAYHAKNIAGCAVYIIKLNELANKCKSTGNIQNAKDAMDLMLETFKLKAEWQNALTERVKNFEVLLGNKGG